MKEKLLNIARNMREKSYCPYSKFSVGCALLTKDGSIYTGANIENSSFSATVCAERVAFFKAISENKRDFSAIAIVGARVGEEPKEPCFPCGVCRQVMSEFCNKDFKIYLLSDENILEYSLSSLIPYAFELEKQ